MHKELQGGTRFYIVRHGATETGGNGSIAGGKWDVSLSAKGREQAEALATKFENTRIDKIISSDMERAVNTAGPLAQSKRLEVTTTPLLRERTYGYDVEGKKKDWEAKAIMTELFRFWTTDQEERKTLRLTPDMETDTEMMDRVTPVFHNTAEEHPNQTVLFMAHCDLMSTFLRTEVSPKELYNPENIGHIVVDFNKPTFELVAMDGVPRIA